MTARRRTETFSVRRLRDACRLPLWNGFVRRALRVLTGSGASRNLARKIFMKKIAYAAFASAAALALAACGNSDGANEEASAENVEMPAEEAVGGVDATPVPEAATTPATDAAAATPAPTDTASAAAEAATVEAEKKM
jgi:hypothetical protein